MLPKKQLLEKAIADGAMKEVNELLSAAYLLSTISFSLHDDASEILQKYGLNLGTIKKFSNDLTKAFDRYINDFGQMVRMAGQQSVFAQDYDEYKDHILGLLGFGIKDESGRYDSLSKRDKEMMAAGARILLVSLFEYFSISIEPNKEFRALTMDNCEQLPTRHDRKVFASDFLCQLLGNRELAYKFIHRMEEKLVVNYEVDKKSEDGKVEHTKISSDYEQ